MAKAFAGSAQLSGVRHVRQHGQAAERFSPDRV